MNNIMLDLETLDTKPTGVILSIGAVAFGESGLGKDFYRTIDVQSCVDAGLTISVSTFKWWMAQPGAARKALFEESVELGEALEEFRKWVKTNFDLATVKVWGNGSDFDNAMLQHAYGKLGRRAPWNFWNNRCYRTTCDLLNAPQRKQEGVHHNAKDDAISQAKHLVETFNARMV
jgi:hypothetical protein